MSTLRLTVKTVTPLIMFGANNDMKSGEPELRASSIRGSLRYWLRAVLGNEGLNPSDLYNRESAILGSTEQGSRVNVRVALSRNVRTSPALSVIPERTSKGFTLQQPGFEADNAFRITFSTHPLDKTNVLSETNPLVKAIFLLTHLGGLGRRSRRGSGCLLVVDANGYDNHELPMAALPKDQTELVQHLSNICRFITPQTVTIGSRPSYPTFAWDTAAVLVGNQARATYQDAYQDLWRASGPYHHEGGIFGDVRPRRSSAMHMRVSLTEAGYVPMQTILYTGNGNWNAMQNYIQYQLANGFSDVYGTWGHWR